MADTESTYDLVVIGAGPGGYAAAFYAADNGLKVALVEKDKALGGVCLNRGCIPSKALLHVARLLDEAEEAAQMGLEFAKPKIHLDKLRGFKNDVILKLNNGIEALAKARKVRVLNGSASFKDVHTLTITGSSGQAESLSFKHAIVATGSSPIIPGALRVDSPRVMDSTGALRLDEIPDEFLLVGGGVIGLELGSVYAALGSKVTVIEALPELAAPVDRDLFRPLEKRLKKKFKAIHTETSVLRMVENGRKIDVEYKKGEEVTTASFDRVLLCIGRSPNSKGLGLENIGVAVDNRGFIETKSTMQTGVEHIYAIGDVTTGPMLAHKASREGRIAVERILGQKSEFDHTGVPAVIYTDPEIAWVGLTEKEAQGKNIAYKLGRFPWAASGKAMTSMRTEGLTKILFHPESERILGVGIVGINAGELIAEAVLALEMGCSVGDITGTIHAHPTLSETMMESAEALHGMATHIYSKK